MKKIIAGAMLGSIILLSGCSTLFPTKLEKAGSACDFQTVDNGHGLIFDMTEESEAQMNTVGCILYELDTPQTILAKMDHTSALSGVQTAEWDGISASWTYHPDNGFDIIFTE